MGIRPAPRLAIIILSVTVFVMGCSNNNGSEEPTYEVTGKITLDGKPMPQGTISFELDPPQGKGPVIAEITNGTYSARVPAGKQKVQFHLEKKVPSTMAGEEGQVVSTEGLPARYNRESKITMEVSAEKEKNEFNHQLRSR